MDRENKIFENLLTEYFYGDISDADREKLFAMMLNERKYKEKYEELAELNALLYIPRSKAKKEENYEKIKEKLEFEKKDRKKINISLLVAAASIVLIAISSFLSILIYDSNMPKNISTSIDIATPNGGQTKLHLPDGSIAWLNAKSSLRYRSDFGLTNRELELEGEAYFEVKQNKELAFTVNTSNLQVVAVGTSFNVRSYQDDMNRKVQLLSGCVDVSTPEEDYRLEPNQELNYDVLSKSSLIDAFDKDRAASWIKGRLSFENISLRSIIKELERHYNRDIVIESEYIDQEYFMGSINLNMDFYDALTYLDVDKKFVIEKRENSFVIRDRK